MDHAGVGGSFRDGVGYAGVGWVMLGWGGCVGVGWGGVGHIGVGWGRSYRVGIGWVMKNIKILKILYYWCLYKQRHCFVCKTVIYLHCVLTYMLLDLKLRWLRIACALWCNN